MFNIMHRNFEYRLLRALDNQALNQKIFQAQGMSRLGFVTDEINVKTSDTLAAIEEHSSQIVNGTDAECIINAREALENAIEYTGASMNSAVDELFFYYNRLQGDFFFPLLHTILLESNQIQYMTLFKINGTNVVSNFDEAIETLESVYSTLVANFENAMQNLADEVDLFNDGLNEINQNFFPELTSFKDYFMFQATLIQNNLPDCEE